MRVVIETVPHDQQRYETCGDWEWNGDTLNIRVSELGDWRMELGVGLHEAVEAALCRHLGITQEVVDAFDLNYEVGRQLGDLSEPGDEPNCPYARPHCIGTAVERMLLPYFGLTWGEYEDAINSLWGWRK